MLYGVMKPVEVAPKQFQHQRFGKLVRSLHTAKKAAIKQGKDAYVVDIHNNVHFHQLYSQTGN